MNYCPSRNIQRNAIPDAGFGPGQVVERAALKATERLIAGIELPAGMVAVATRLNKTGIASGTQAPGPIGNHRA